MVTVASTEYIYVQAQFIDQTKAKDTEFFRKWPGLQTPSLYSPSWILDG